jgi:hypothetical protein
MRGKKIGEGKIGREASLEKEDSERRKVREGKTSRGGEGKLGEGK